MMFYVGRQHSLMKNTEVLILTNSLTLDKLLMLRVLFLLYYILKNFYGVLRSLNFWFENA